MLLFQIYDVYVLIFIFIRPPLMTAIALPQQLKIWGPKIPRSIRDLINAKTLNNYEKITKDGF